MSDIYYGRKHHPWAIDIEDWKVDPNQSLKDYEDAQKMVDATTS